MLTLLGVDELIATDRDEYVDIAARLARDHGRRAELGERIRAAKASLSRDQGVVAALAQFLRTVEAPAVSAAQAERAD
jgi:protein O-GlcNAc transferase